MNYEKLYKNALERAREQYNKRTPLYDIESIFPELQESEDERIRKWLIDWARAVNWSEQFTITKEQVIAWLEKQGENKPTYKVKPKFKVGDWITDEQLICKVLSVTGKSYELHLYNDDYCHFETDVQSVDKHYRLWTIADAKDGDVLTNWNNTTFIFKAIEDETVKFHIAYNEKWDTIKTPTTKLSHLGLAKPEFEFQPAAKEQRDFLFQKMKEAGYEWDADKKELKKIEPKILGADDILPYLGNNQVQDILEDMGMLDDNGQCPHTAEEIFKAGMEHAFNLNREDTSSIKLDADKVIE